MTIYLATTTEAVSTFNAVWKIMVRRDRIVVSTLRCGRNNPGSNPGHGT